MTLPPGDSKELQHSDDKAVGILYAGPQQNQDEQFGEGEQYDYEKGSLKSPGTDLLL